MSKAHRCQHWRYIANADIVASLAMIEIIKVLSAMIVKIMVLLAMMALLVVMTPYWQQLMPENVATFQSVVGAKFC